VKSSGIPLFANSAKDERIPREEQMLYPR
jgi:hypothetical protein